MAAPDLALQSVDTGWERREGDLTFTGTVAITLLAKNEAVGEKAAARLQSYLSSTRVTRDNNHITVRFPVTTQIVQKLRESEDAALYLLESVHRLTKCDLGVNIEAFTYQHPGETKHRPMMKLGLNFNGGLEKNHARFAGLLIERLMKNNKAMMESCGLISADTNCHPTGNRYYWDLLAKGRPSASRLRAEATAEKMAMALRDMLGIRGTERLVE